MLFFWVLRYSDHMRNTWDKFFFLLQSSPICSQLQNSPTPLTPWVCPLISFSHLGCPTPAAFGVFHIRQSIIDSPSHNQVKPACRLTWVHLQTSMRVSKRLSLAPSRVGLGLVGCGGEVPRGVHCRWVLLSGGTSVPFWGAGALRGPQSYIAANVEDQQAINRT